MDQKIMFEARLLEGAILKKIAEAIKDIQKGGVNFHCSSDGIRMEAMDSSHISLVSLFLQKSGFQLYRINKNFVMGISMETLVTILKNTADKDMVTIKKEDDSDEVTFVMEATDQDRINHYSIKLLDVDEESLTIPESQNEFVITMPSPVFKKSIDQVAVIGDTCEICVCKDNVKFTAVSTMGKADAIIKGEKIQIQIAPDHKENELSLTFAWRYLSFIAKGGALSDNVTINMNREEPIRFEYQLESLGFVRYYLAPKVTNDL
jgi:proliferating cell nuclear antigen